MHRDIEPQARRAEVRVGRRVVAVIGIDRYHDWPRLENAVGDALGAAQLFVRLGFEQVTAPLLDEAATGDAMRRLVTDELSQLSPDDSLVVFFAGHGHTHIASVGSVTVKTGCVIPVDAASPRGHVSASWLRLDSWLSDIARLPPRHILVIVDACYSGIALGPLNHWRDKGSWPATELDALQARRSRRIITSALDDQRAMDNGPVPGHSLFTGCLIEGLSGGLAEAGRRTVTGRELGLYLQRRVGSYPQSTQTPDFGTFELDDRGDMILPILPLAGDEDGAPSEASAAWTMPRDARLTLPSTIPGLGLAAVPRAAERAGAAAQPSPSDAPAAGSETAVTPTRLATTTPGVVPPPPPSRPWLAAYTPPRPTPTPPDLRSSSRRHPRGGAVAAGPRPTPDPHSSGRTHPRGKARAAAPGSTSPPERRTRRRARILAVVAALVGGLATGYTLGPISHGCASEEPQPPITDRGSKAPQPPITDRGSKAPWIPETPPGSVPAPIPEDAGCPDALTDAVCRRPRRPVALMSGR